MKRFKILNVFIAKSLFARFWGLMGKRQWPKNLGGLYFPRCSGLHTFFTFLNPDIVFLDKEHKILKINSRVKPWKFLLGPRGCQNCLELPGRTTLLNRLKKGDYIQIVKKT